jgi:hypothetical protein
LKPYVPRWESLLEAINRMVARGLAEADAKSVLCNGIADRKIEVQLQLGRNATNSMVSGEPLTGEDVQIPAQLSPGDMDWLNSRPLVQASESSDSTAWPPFERNGSDRLPS